MNEKYQYKEREVIKDPANEFRFGEGRISGMLSLLLSGLKKP